VFYNEKQFIKFARTNLFVMLLMFALHAISHSLLPPERISPLTPYIILFFSIFNMILFYMKLWISKSKDVRFINLFMILNSAKMLLFIAIIALYSYFYRDDALNFSISFFICYAVFTSILVRSFNKLQKVH